MKSLQKLSATAILFVALTTPALAIESPGGVAIESPGGVAIESPGGVSIESPGGVSIESPGGYTTAIESPGGISNQRSPRASSWFEVFRSFLFELW